MKATSAVLLAAAGASLTSATPTPQAFSNVTQPAESGIQCPGPDGSFCIGEGLATIVSCTGGIAGPAVDCCEQTASQPPLGSQDATCYQSSPVAGDAACTKNCMVYPTNGSPWPLPGDCKPADEAPPAPAPGEHEPFEPMEPMFPTDHDAPDAEAAPEHSVEAPPPPPPYTSAETPPAEASASPTPPPMGYMSADIKPPFPVQFPGPMFNMTLPPDAMPPAMPSPSAEAPPPPPGGEAPSTLPAMPMPPMMPPKETPPPSGPAPEVFTKPLIQVSSPPAPEVFSKPLIMAPSAPPAPPALEVPSPTPAAPTPPAIPSDKAPPAAQGPPGPPAPPAPAPPAPPGPPTPPNPVSAPPAISTPAATPPPSDAAPPAYSLPLFFSHILSNWVHPPASSIPLPTTDMIASSTIPFKASTHSYASPAPAPPGPAYTYTSPSDFSLLPKATLPTYITTVTIGTKTQYHTVFSDCGNGTMVFGSSTVVLPTGSTPNEVPLWHTTGSLPPLPTITTVPCSEASAWNNTALYTPKKTSASYSYIATLPASATATPNSLFSQGDGYDHSGVSSANQMSRVLLAGLVFGIVAIAL